MRIFFEDCMRILWRDLVLGSFYEYIVRWSCLSKPNNYNKNGHIIYVLFFFCNLCFAQLQLLGGSWFENLAIIGSWLEIFFVESWL